MFRPRDQKRYQKRNKKKCVSFVEGETRFRPIFVRQSPRSGPLRSRAECRINRPRDQKLPKILKTKLRYFVEGETRFQRVFVRQSPPAPAPCVSIPRVVETAKDCLKQNLYKELAFVPP